MHGLFLWKIKKGTTLTNTFQEVLKESNRKPNKIWVDKGSEFYSRLMKSWLEINAIEKYSTHKEGKSVVAERFIRTLKNKTYKYMTSISKNIYIDKPDDIAIQYNNVYHSTIIMKLFDIKSDTYIGFSKEINNEDPKFKIGDIVRISKHKTIFTKDCTPNWSEEVFLIKKVKNTVPWKRFAKNSSKRIQNWKSSKEERW